MLWPGKLREPVGLPTRLATHYHCQTPHILFPDLLGHVARTALQWADAQSESTFAPHYQTRLVV